MTLRLRNRRGVTILHVLVGSHCSRAEYSVPMPDGSKIVGFYEHENLSDGKADWETLRCGVFNYGAELQEAWKRLNPEALH